MLQMGSYFPWFFPLLNLNMNKRSWCCVILMVMKNIFFFWQVNIFEMTDIRQKWDWAHRWQQIWNRLMKRYLIADSFAFMVCSTFKSVGILKKVYTFSWWQRFLLQILHIILDGFLAHLINPLRASVALNLLCRSIDWFLYKGNTGT